MKEIYQLQEGQFEQNQQSNKSQQSEFIKTTKAGRKNLCDVCVKSLAKYTCPNCETKSCSLLCVNKHKNTKECNGKQMSSKYVQKNKIGEDVVRKDFQFVKSMLEETDKVKKTLTGVTTQIQEPKRFYFLRKHARSEYNIKLHQAPAMIERHRENISFYYMKTKTIYWVIEILYYRGNKKYSKFLIEQPKPDSMTIQQILPTVFLCQQLLLKQVNTQKTEQFDVFLENKEVVTPQIEKQQREQRDQPPQKKEKNDKIEEIPQNQKKCIEVEKTMKLCDALRNLNIYQFPTLILVHKNLRKQFTKWKKMT